MNCSPLNYNSTKINQPQPSVLNPSSRQEKDQYPDKEGTMTIKPTLKLTMNQSGPKIRSIRPSRHLEHMNQSGPKIRSIRPIRLMEHAASTKI